MRIAQVAPLIEAVPPRSYGGTERVVSWLTEELVRQGHQVTLFASGDSKTGAELVAGSPQALRFDANAIVPEPYHLVMLDRLQQRLDDFDVVHFHIDYLHFPLFKSIARQTLTTLHGRLDLPFLEPVFRHFNRMPLVSISMHQRRPMRQANWIGTVHHGLPRDLLPYCEAPTWDYLAFLGRICPEKRVDRAIRIAKRVGMKLKIAAKVDKADRAYFASEVEPLLDDPLIEFVGEVNDGAKRDFLGNAYAMLFPIDWPEPFGLVMIEAMACGVPVIAWRNGSVPEVIEHGLTGLIVEDEDEAVSAVKRARMLNRRLIRKRFEERFSVERMAGDYLELYEQAAYAKRSKLPAISA
ncbi:MAG: glycosyltransferase family 4 protein [Rhodospirillales bacterium]|nr:glycosyltransferase family 4 protein [Rhodospirillales bacterium]